jgi:hypothetical protein
MIVISFQDDTHPDLGNPRKAGLADLRDFAATVQRIVDSDQGESEK